ncbi:histone deacetylase complex subunit cti6, partial [Tolypocladium capitatum]
LASQPGLLPSLFDPLPSFPICPWHGRVSLPSGLLRHDKSPPISSTRLLFVSRVALLAVTPSHSPPAQAPPPLLRAVTHAPSFHSSPAPTRRPRSLPILLPPRTRRRPVLSPPRPALLRPPSMAPPSPRRSSRARVTNSLSQQSSISSGTSGRLERSTRSLNKPSSGKSTPSASLSSEPLDDLDDTLLGRRRKRGQDEEQEKPILVSALDMANGSDDLQDEEDEAVRCICGSEDYPGRPPVEGPDADFFAAIELTEDVTGFFVQCDICKVWQHGACVGIFSAESSPEEYFCEQCRKNLHKIHTAINGQKYSKFLPIHGPSRATSRATSIAKEGTRSPRHGSSKPSRPNSASQAAAKRRSTMNSRDAAYDDELLRRVIEASKEDVPNDTAESTSRRGKRGRSDSEESVAPKYHRLDASLTRPRHSASVKRQRTGSRSASPPADQPDTNGRDGTDDEANMRNGAKKPRNIRHQREISEKEERERQRQEAAHKRKGRAERRRAEGECWNEILKRQEADMDLFIDSDLSEEIPLAAAKAVQHKSVEPPNTVESPTTAQPPGTPPTSHPTTASSHKRGTRSNHKKGKGRNQYTKDRDPDNEESPARSMSRDIQKNGDETTGHSKSSTSDHKHGSKGKQAMANKMSMLDMKRRVSAIMEFISRTQLDLAAENRDSSGQDTPQKDESAQTNAGSAAEKPEGEGATGNAPDASDAATFKRLNCMEMMDVLTRDMVKWQNQYV